MSIITKLTITAILVLSTMQEALNVAGLQPKDIDYINAHGTATPNNDLSESHAIKTIFTDNIPPFSSTKAYTGHTLAASGGIEDQTTGKQISDIFLYEGSKETQASLEDVSLFLNQAVADPSLMPYQNISYKSIVDAKVKIADGKRRPPKMPRVTYNNKTGVKDISVGNARNYITDVVLARTLTNLAKPRVTTTGEYVYTTNTIILRIDFLIKKTK